MDVHHGCQIICHLQLEAIVFVFFFKFMDMALRRAVALYIISVIATICISNYSLHFDGTVGVIRMVTNLNVCCAHEINQLLD